MESADGQQRFMVRYEMALALALVPARLLGYVDFHVILSRHYRLLLVTGI